MDMTVENGKVSAFRTRVALSFKYEPGEIARLVADARARRSGGSPRRDAIAAGAREIMPVSATVPHTLIFSSSSTRATAGRFVMRSLNAV